VPLKQSRLQKKRPRRNLKTASVVGDKRMCVRVPIVPWKGLFLKQGVAQAALRPPIKSPVPNERPRRKTQRIEMPLKKMLHRRVRNFFPSAKATISSNFLAISAVSCQNRAVEKKFSAGQFGMEAGHSRRAAMGLRIPCAPSWRGAGSTVEPAWIYPRRWHDATAIRLVDFK